MLPPEAVRDELARARSPNEAFEEAWADALERVADQEWRAALEETVDGWRAAFEGKPAPRAVVALVACAIDPEREALSPDCTGRACEWCAGIIPASRRRHARYCSRACARARHGRRVAA